MKTKPLYLSTIIKVPASYFVYSSFGFFGRHRGGELPGPWFVEALGAAGREESVIRQTLYRMEREHELVTRRAGRVKFYAPSTYARAEVDAGAAKIFASPAGPWDGQWTMVRVGLRSPATEKHRERVIALLAVHGFARVDANLFVHPRVAVEGLRNALPARARPDTVIIRGALAGPESLPSLLALFRVGTLAERYRAVIRRLEALEALRRDPVDDRTAFLMRFAVVFDYLAVAWDDPELPAGLLPAGWPGDAARALAARLYTRLLPGATRYADLLLDDVLNRQPSPKR